MSGERNCDHSLHTKMATAMLQAAHQTVSSTKARPIDVIWSSAGLAIATAKGAGFSLEGFALLLGELWDETKPLPMGTLQ